MKHVISPDGTKIAYTHEGQGPTIVLVGGALQTKSDHLFGALIPLLAKNFTVVSYDRRGRGESGNTAPYAVEREIEDLKAVIEATSESAFVFGNSSGGHLALMTSTLCETIRGLAVYEAPFVSEEKLGRADEYLTKLKESVLANQPEKTLSLFFRRIGVPHLMITAMKFMSMWKDLKKLAPTLVNDATLVGNGSVPVFFESVPVRTLLLSGSSQQMVQAAKDAASVIPNSEVRVLKRQKHAVEPTVLADALEQFFRAL